MTIASLLRTAKRHIGVALLVAIVTGLLGGLFVSLTSKSTTQASATVTLVPTSTMPTDVNAQQNMSQLVSSAIELFSTPRVQVPASESVSPTIPLIDLQRRLVVKSGSQSLIALVTFSDEDPARAEQVLKASIDAFQKELAGAPFQGDVMSIDMGTVTYDTQTEEGPGLLMAIASGIAVGVLLGLTYLVVRILLDSRIWVAADIADLTDDSVIAVIDGSNRAEAARLLAHDVDYLAPGHGPRTIGFGGLTTAGPAAGIARAVADELAVSHRTTLVDLDLSGRPLGDANPGAADVISQRVGLAAALNGTDDGVRLLSAGGPVPNPVELAGNDGVGSLLQEVGQGSDWALVTVAPLLASGAGSLVARRLDAFVLVVEAGAATRPQLREALAIIESGSVPLAGIALVAAS
ncbi:hypothetical protein BW730_16065 [Tessaracoccus aquimaris]|uniref:Polysaccharide chain length determinant N-terminal domain-containing protein n=1 Tax=Tessaracoccus aquimaris TaxID=1332264 RepID=A0A1Q2CRR0_9ACTN|nr:hypothetical protein [Tessaracoccus aquimaris]AQP48794.1 hypothetical protein BW730_16065 [Tessaracoccus aquimaris]